MMKNRKRHTWQPNKRQSRPRHVIFVDVESNLLQREEDFVEHTLRLGWACYQRNRNERGTTQTEWLYFEDIETFWDFVESHCNPKEKVNVVGHGLGYDLGILHLVSTAKERGWERGFNYHKGSNCLITYKTGRGSIRFLSTTNLFNTNLRKLGKLVGLEKKEVDFKTVDDKTLSDYCKRDVEIVIRLWDLWIEFLNTHDLGDFKGTIASQAFAAYRHRFMPCPIWIHGDMDVCKLERESYRGGRCEVFRQGEFPKGDYFELDVNGLYGYIMETGTFPCDFIRLFTTIRPHVLKKMVDKYSLIARVKIKTDLPVFPVKMNGVNCYPTGTFETVLTTPEIAFAFEHCEILEVKEVATYKSYPLFTEYAKYFSDLKGRYSKERNDTFRMISKLFNNALYGKLAQRDYNTKKRKEREIERGLKVLPKSIMLLGELGFESLKGVWEKWGQLVWSNLELSDLPIGAKRVRVGKWSALELLGRKPKTKIVRNLGRKHAQTGLYELPDRNPFDNRELEEVEESYNSFPAISAHVTAYARLHLWKLMVLAGRGNVFYSDTDGFITNRQGYENCQSMIHPHKSGHLKIERQAETLTIWRRKGYQFGDDRVICGIRKNAKELDNLVFEQDQFLGIPGAIRQGNPDKRGVSRVVKEVNTTIKGGIVGQDGWVIPFHLDNGVIV